MNLREFCEEREYPLTLALSYSFDPLFFDRIVLRALWSGGAQEALVLADGDEVDRALARVHGPIHHLGRHYVLAPVRRPGRFHPKMILRLGNDRGIVAIGSGNLTHGGWGLNQEVAVAWRVGPEVEDTGAWIPDILERAAAWADSPLAQRTLERMWDLPWLERGAPGRLLVSGPAALATQLERRWAGRRFTNLRFATGSTDGEGAMLRWLHEAFGVEHAVGCVTPSHCALRPDRMRALPIHLQLVPHLAPITHAKMYHLAGPDGDVLLVGSANCSPAAWLRSPAEGGNVEMLLVYEAAASPTLAVLDDMLRGAAQSPDDVLIGGLEEVDNESRERPELALVSFQVEEDGGLVARLRPEVRGSWACQAVIEHQPVPLDRANGAWTGRAPEMLPAGQTAFGYVEARDEDGRIFLSGRRWLDDLRVLHESSIARGIARGLEQLAKPSSRREDDELLQDLARLAHDLIHDAHAIQDPLARRRTSKELIENERVLPVDPEQLIRSLRDEPVPLTHPKAGTGGPGASFSGIFRALFGAQDGHEEGHEVSLDEAEAAQAGSEEEESAQALVESPMPVVALPVQKRDRDRFERHLDRFMEGLRSEEFQKGCTATRLVQAIGYPFAATALGLERSWTDPDRARPWVLEAASLLLYGAPNGGRPLLQQVRERYANDGSEELFQQIVGDGMLWVTMLVGLAGIRWPDQRSALQHLLLIRDLWKTEELRARPEPGHVETLIRRYRAGDAVRAVTELAAPVAASLASVERRLAALVEREPRALQDARSYAMSGELLWGPRNGWAVALEDERGGKALVYWISKGRETRMQLVGHFMTVRQVAKWNCEIAAALERALCLVQGTPE